MQEITLLRNYFVKIAIQENVITIGCCLLGWIWCWHIYASLKKGLLTKKKGFKAAFYLSFFICAVGVGLISLPRFTRMLWDLPAYYSDEYQYINGYAISGKKVEPGTIELIGDYQYQDDAGEIHTLYAAYSEYLDEGEPFEGALYPHVKMAVALKELPAEYRNKVKEQLDSRLEKSTKQILAIIAYLTIVAYAALYVVNGLTAWKNKKNTIYMNYPLIRKLLLPIGALLPILLVTLSLAVESTSIIWGYISVYIFWLVYALSAFTWAERCFSVKLDEKRSRIMITWGIKLWSQKEKESIPFSLIDSILVSETDDFCSEISIKYLGKELLLRDKCKERVYYFEKTILCKDDATV